jgi:hypothetical protein
MSHSDYQTESSPVAARSQDTPQHTSGALVQEEPSKVSVFISYAHNDDMIAQTLYNELIDVNRDRVNCFLDTRNIQSGRNFEDELDRALDQADWLVCIYTGEQSEYCGYEVGVFKKTRSISSGTNDDRLVCMHDVEIVPGVFRNHQNHLVIFPPDRQLSVTFDESSFYLSSPVASFFKNFYKYKNLYVPKDSDDAQRQLTKLIGQTRRITEAFKAGQRDDPVADTPTQLRIEVSIPCYPEERLTKVPGEAKITGTFHSLRLFGLMPHMHNKQLPVTSWGRLKQEVMNQNGGQTPLWIENIEQDMINAANGLALTGLEMSFGSDGKMWRPILNRHILYKGGGHKFEIIFVETIPRQFLGAKTTSALLASIIMASRFRFAYFEEPDAPNIGFRSDLNDRLVDVRCRQLLYDVERLEHEAMEFGLDNSSFLRAFGKENRALAESFMLNWEAAKQEFLSTVRPAAGSRVDCSQESLKRAVDKFLQTVEHENRQFLLVAIDIYRSEMRRRLGAEEIDEGLIPEDRGGGGNARL